MGTATSKNRVQECCIVGAGPAGLLTATALKVANPHLRVRVFERAKTMKPCGGLIGLGATAIQSLEAAGPQVLEAVKQAGIAREGLIISDKDATVERVFEFKNSSVLSISWYKLQQALFSLLPNDIVTLASAVDEVSETPDGRVSVKMTSGEVIECDMLIGADGNRSACRKYVSQSEPEYVGASVWRFIIPELNPLDIPLGYFQILQHDGKIVTVVSDQQDGKSVTYCSGLSGWPAERLGELNSSRYIQASREDTQTLDAKLARFKATFEGFSPLIINFITDNCVPESALEHPMYAIQPRAPWHKGKVVLVGDAAHAMPPNLAQGTPTAFGDAIQLAASIKELGVTEAALQHYEEIRKNRVIPIWDESTSQAIDYYSKGIQSRSPFFQSMSKG